MLVLDKYDMMKVISYSAVMDKVEEAYRIFSNGEFNMANRFTAADDRDSVMYMPCFMKSCFGTKILTLFPGNPEKGLPFIDGLMLLNDRETGKVLCIMDGSALTAIRTGAVGGVGIRHFSRADAKSMGVIGAGKQGLYQVLYALEARNIKDVFLFSRHKRDWNAYISSLKASLGSKNPIFHVCGSAAELVANCDIVVTATTSKTPVMPDDAALLHGRCFIAIGSYKPTMREMPDAIWSLTDSVFTELPYAKQESGDLSQPLQSGIIDDGRIKYIGDLLTENPCPKPPEPGETTFFKSVGMALLDLNVANYIFEEAKRLGAGHKIDTL